MQSMPSMLLMARREQERRPPEKVEPKRMRLWYLLMKSALLCGETRGREWGGRVTMGWGWHEERLQITSVTLEHMWHHLKSYSELFSALSEWDDSRFEEFMYIRIFYCIMKCCILFEVHRNVYLKSTLGWLCTAWHVRDCQHITYKHKLFGVLLKALLYLK